MTKVKMSNVLARPKPPDTLPPPPEPKSQPRPQLPPQTHPPPPPLTPDRPTQVLVCSQLHQDIQMWIKTSKCGLRHNCCTVANVFRLLPELTHTLQPWGQLLGLFKRNTECLGPHGQGICSVCRRTQMNANACRRTHADGRCMHKRKCT